MNRTDRKNRNETIYKLWNKDGKTQREIAERFDITTEQVNRIIKNMKSRAVMLYKDDKERNEFMFALHKTGWFTYGDIARLYGLDYQTVYRIIRLMELKQEDEWVEEKAVEIVKKIKEETK